ncbi:MAG: ABC transporter ATP-binding protein [Asgard group archaeon]|nr:ABC transporter ATP-binding protein [Asgard group archaeon]
MISIRDVTFKYSKAPKPILENFSLEINENEIIGIIGPTGSGKSTICYLLNGLIPHYFKGSFFGSVIVNGRNVKKESVETMSEIIGYMLQEPSFQIASPFVESEITFGMENYCISKEEMDNRLVSIMEKLGITHLREQPTSDLSEGEKQKVVLASILVMNPPILVLDESSSMVDSTSKKQLIEILKELNSQEDKTIILVDHDLDFLSQIANRIILINNGSIISDGFTKKILSNVNLLSENGLHPPSLVSLFNAFKNENFPIKDLPIKLEPALEILRGWLQ